MRRTRWTMPAEFVERTWLTWLGKVRILILTFLVAVGLAITAVLRNNIDLRIFLAVMALWYAVGFGFILLRSIWNDWGMQARLEVFTDLVFSAAVIYVT